MNKAGRRHGARRARLDSRRRSRDQGYGRFLSFTFLGALVPGTGLIAAGKRRLGMTILVLVGVLVVTGLAMIVLTPRGKLASYAGDRQMMFLLGGALAVGAVTWLLIAVSTHQLLEPDGLSVGKRLGGSLVVVLAASIIVAPMAVGSKYAFTQRDLIGAISSSGGSNTTPELDEKDPWAHKPRLNVLFLGGDAGEGRRGLRPDTQILASIDTTTGATTMISLPRNLQRFPFPSDSPLAQVYPDGFTGSGDAGEWMLNAVYRNVPPAHPEVFEGVGDPGADANKWAVEGALGIDVDYFMMVDLAGFQAVVDALGGITVDVPRDIPYGNKSLPDGTCTQANGYINAGKDQHLDGFHALWFARSRCGSDDYDRMQRQRCVMNAIVHEVDPATLLSKYQRLASTAGDIISTDVPEGLFPALIELMLKVKGSSLTSLTLDNSFFGSMGTTSADPDYDALHARIAEILADSADVGHPSGTAAPHPAEPSEQPSEEDPGSSTPDGDALAQVSPAPSDTPGDSEPKESTTDPDPSGSGDSTAKPDQPVETGKVC